jgi:tricorn protease
LTAVTCGVSSPREVTMRRFIVFLGVAALALASVATAATPARFMQYPAVSGERIVFSYEGDLWSVGIDGGLAQRLTSHPGLETAPKLSPDGTQLVFTGSYDGAAALYVMPASGGVPTRVTTMGSNVQAVAWTPDGKRIVFRSGHESTFRPIVRLYSVPPTGGLPERLPVERGILCSFSADGSKMVYNRRGNEEYYWKRYKGGQYTDIWSYDFKANRFEQLTDYVGKNTYPMWIGDTMFFVSDRGANGIANLYSYGFAGRKVEQVTRYEDFDVMFPATDGARIVYIQAGRLHVRNVTSGNDRALEVQVTSDRWQLAERTINPKEYVHSMAVANDGKSAVFEARGDIFVVPADELAPTRNVTQTPGSRERWPQLSPDGSKVAFFSDKTGEYQLYVTETGGGKPWEQLITDLDRHVYHLEWSPDGSKILFGNKDFTLFYLDVASKKLHRIASSNQLKNDEFYWEVSDYSWSPDSKWVAYSFVQFNRNNKVFLYSLEQDKSFPVTDEFYDCLNPSFDASGELLYFLSYRNFEARLDIFEDNHVIPNPVQVMAVQLKAGQRPPFEKRPKDEKKTEAAPFRIDLPGISERVFELPVEAGNYFYLKAGKGLVTWGSRETFGDDEIEQVFTPAAREDLTLHLYDVGSQKETKIEATISDWKLSANREHTILKKGGAYHLKALDKLAGDKSLGDKLNLDKMTYRVVPAAEWTQIFNDAWRWYRDFFYDGNMHGRNWQKMGETYRAFIPALSSRNELNWLLSQMVGELCVSHTYVGGGDTGPQKPPETPVFTGLLGADLAADPSGYYRFARIYGPTEIERDLQGPLVRPDIDVKEDDLLLAINGKEIKAPDDPFRYLQVTRGEKVRLSVGSKPGMATARTYDVEPIRNEYMLRYNRWLADNIAKVTKATNGEVGYMHITAMGADNVAQFDKFWRAFRYKKGIIIDVRGNGGGWTEYFLIDKLERKMTAYNVLKNMEPFRYPGSVTNGPIVVVTNEYNGSDGEAFLEHFKARKLGTVIGVPSWGGLVGIVNAQRTIDNGSVNQSNNAFWGAEGEWLVENHGADPDIVVDNDPASASAGRDAQLDRAIEVVLQQIKDTPFTFPARPAYPVK